MLAALALSNRASCDAILDAARDGDVAKVTALLNDNPRLVFSTDPTCVHVATAHPLTFLCSGGATPLHVVARNGHPGVAAQLLDNRARALCA